jgi:4-amino-4-deoxy-L-arabinose transferase-like glycosyltransferase
MRRLLPLVLAVLLAMTLLPGMAAIDAIDVREARDAQVAREASPRHDWITPTYEHDPFFDKPLFAYAPELMAQHVLHRLSPRATPAPTDAGASRAVRVVIAAVLALLVSIVGIRAFGGRAGWLGGCALASLVGLPLATRADGTQLMATLCSWTAIGALLSVLQKRTRHPEIALLAGWLALGAAMLVGGPLSALWPIAGFGLYIALSRSHAGWRELRPGSGLLIVLGLALPWYGLMAMMHPGEFFSHLAWFPYAMEPRGNWLTGPLVALSYPMVLGFPFSPVLAASLRDVAERLKQSATREVTDAGHAASLMLCMLVAGSAPVALYPHPPLTAALPAMPALALLSGRFFDRVLDGDADSRLLAGATRFCAILGSGLALIAVVIGARIEQASPGLRLLAATLLLASWAPLLADILSRRKLAAALFVLPVAIGTPIVSLRVLPALEPWLNARDVAEGMEAVAPANAPLVTLEAPPPSLRLLLPRNLVRAKSLAEPLTPLAARDGNVYVAFPPALEHAAARTSPVPIEILLRSPTLVLARVGLAPPALQAPLPAAVGGSAPRAE